MVREFRLDATLAQGPYDIVYSATDTQRGEDLALREYFPDSLASRARDQSVRARLERDRPDLEAGLAAFIDEARLLARFRHPNIIGVRRFFELNDTAYIVMDAERGRLLASRLEDGPLARHEVYDLLVGLLDGLDTLHQRRVLHCSLCPGNILLRDDGSPVITDFAAAREVRGRQDGGGIAGRGPAGYAAPELGGAGGRLGPWTDIYAVGAVAYRCVTGSVPPEASRRRRRDPMTPAEEVAKGRYPVALLRGIDLMLQIEETRRPGSIDDVREALKSVRRGLRFGKRGWAMMAASALVLSLGAWGVVNLETLRQIVCDRVSFCSKAKIEGEAKASPAHPDDPAAVQTKPGEVKAPTSPPPRLLTADDVAWKMLGGIADTDQLQRFIEQFPDSPHAKEASAAISGSTPHKASP
jgi:serine/threonine protein kinase